MDPDAPTALGQIEGHGAAEPAACAGHEHGRGSVVLSHFGLWEEGRIRNVKRLAPAKRHSRGGHKSEQGAAGAIADAVRGSRQAHEFGAQIGFGRGFGHLPEV